MVSFLVVATPHLLPCPVDPRTLADSPDPDKRRRRRRRNLEEEACDDGLSEEWRKRKLLEEKLAPKRECPIPKPGGLVGQVLGLKNMGSDDYEEPLSVIRHVEKARGKTQSKDNQ